MGFQEDYIEKLVYMYIAHVKQKASLYFNWVNRFLRQSSLSLSSLTGLLSELCLALSDKLTHSEYGAAPE